MALIVEDGTGKVDSDSYIALADARTYAASYGIALPVDDAECEVSIRQGTIYVDLQESRFGGDRLTSAQALAFPRTEYTSSVGIDIAEGDIPKQLGYASVYAAAEYAAGVDVRANDNGQVIASEEVTGAVKVSYFDSGSTGAEVTITKANDALKAIYAPVGNTGFAFRVNRA